MPWRQVLDRLLQAGWLDWLPALGHGPYYTGWPELPSKHTGHDCPTTASDRPAEERCDFDPEEAAQVGVGGLAEAWPY